MPDPLDELAEWSNKEPAPPPLDVDPARVGRSQFWFVMLLVGMTFGAILLLLKAGDYGSSLFLALPFTLGVLIGFTGYPRYSYWRFHVWANGICLAVTLLTWMTGFEGAICIIMAYGIVLLPLTAGLFLGTAIWRIRLRNKLPMLLMLCAVNPITYLSERTFPPLYTHEVVTTMEVEAPVQRVWAVLTSPVAFGTSDHFLLRSGVTYPLDMRLDRSGDEPCLVCHLNNLDTRLRVVALDSLRSMAVEPIEQPIPMREVSFIGELDAPHLHGYFGVDRGEFRLERIDDGHTRIIASTRYHHRIAPAFYWRWWSDHLIDAMHRNVLRGVVAKAEGSS